LSTTKPQKSSNFAADFERKGIKEKFDKRKLERKPAMPSLS